MESRRPQAIRTNRNRPPARTGVCGPSGRHPHRDPGQVRQVESADGRTALHERRDDPGRRSAAGGPRVPRLPGRTYSSPGNRGFRWPPQVLGRPQRDRLRRRSGEPAPRVPRSTLCLLRPVDRPPARLAHRRRRRFEPWHYRPKSRRSGLTIHVLEGGRYVEAPSSRAFPGWTAQEIHAALNEWEASLETVDVLRRVADEVAAAEGTGPDATLGRAGQLRESMTRATVTPPRQARRDSHASILRTIPNSTDDLAGPNPHRRMPTYRSSPRQCAPPHSNASTVCRPATPRRG